MKYISSEGSFDAVVTDPKETGWILESSTGTPFIRVPVEVTEDGAEKGAHGIWQGYLSNAAFDRTIKTLVDAFGFNGDLAGLSTGRQTFTGKPCNVTTGAEEYEGRKRIKVKWLNAPGGGAAKPMDKTKLQMLVDSLNKRAMQVAEMATKEDDDYSDPNARGASEKDDDVPF